MSRLAKDIAPWCATYGNYPSRLLAFPNLITHQLLLDEHYPPGKLWCCTSWPAPLLPPRSDTGCWGASRNIRSKFLLPACWSFSFSAWVGSKTRETPSKPISETSINSSIWIAQIAQSISHINGENNEEWALRALRSRISCPAPRASSTHKRLQPINWQAHRKTHIHIPLQNTYNV